MTRPPAPAAGSHGGPEEQAGPRLRTGTPHRSYPEKPGEHEPEWYGGPRPPWTAQRQWRPLCCLPREGRGTERGRATPRPTGPAPAAQPEETAHAPPSPPSPPPSIRAPWTRPAARSPHRDRAGPPHPHARAHNADPDSPPSGRAVGGGGARDPRRPTQRSKATPRGRPAAAPTTPSQVGGNRDRTAPPQARQTEQGTGAGHAEGHGPRGTALPVPGAGTTRDARARPPSGGGSGHRESASAHTRKGHAGTTRRATGPSAENAQTAWNGVPASEGKGQPDGTARHTQRGAGGAGMGKRKRHDARCRPEPPRTCRKRRAHTDGALRPPRQ